VVDWCRRGKGLVRGLGSNFSESTPAAVAVASQSPPQASSHLVTLAQHRGHFLGSGGSAWRTLASVTAFLPGPPNSQSAPEKKVAGIFQGLSPPVGPPAHQRGARPRGPRTQLSPVMRFESRSVDLSLYSRVLAAGSNEPLSSACVPSSPPQAVHPAHDSARTGSPLECPGPGTASS
jgi:hypothetical protein